jgi:long-chain acyl-CoA synthetase
MRSRNVQSFAGANNLNQSVECSPLQSLQRWERERANAIWLTQPLGDGRVRDYSWAQGMDEVRRMAAYLQSFGWEPGSRVAIMSKNCAWWFFAEFAAWMAGLVTVPLYPSLSADSVRYILEHSEAKLLFLGKLEPEDWRAMQQGIHGGIELVRLPLAPADDLPGFNVAEWDAVVAATEALPERVSRELGELATIMYTSGTTGLPKGVMHSFKTFGEVMKSLQDSYHFGPQDRMLSYLPTAHLSDKIASQLPSIATGCRVYFSEGTNTFLADLKRARPTFFASVPRLWTKFRQGVNSKLPQEKLDRYLKIPLLNRIVRNKVLSQLGLENVRFALSGGAPLPPELHTWYLSVGLDLCEGYGQTENFGMCCTVRPGDLRVGTVGRPAGCAEIRFTDEGEILSRTPTLMMGYFKDPERTREAFTHDGWLRTGDIGEADAQGFVRITGRAKEQFKTSKGKYVAPAPIENRLDAHEAIEACCVTGVGFPQPFALLMLAQEEREKRATPEARAELSASLEQLRIDINARLDPHERLDFLAVVADQWSIDNGFITPTFKIRRNVIEKHYGAQFERWAATRLPVVWV